MTHPTFTPPVIGHRGACAYAPENTMASFVKAAQLNIKWVEFDVMQSRDGVPIIFHDETLERTTNGRGQVSDYSYAQLQTLDAGRWFDPLYSGERIPSLMTVVQFLQQAKMSANVEIKALKGQEEEVVSQVIQELQPYLAKANEHYLFSSFSIAALTSLRKHAPHCQLGLLLEGWTPEWKDIAAELECVSIHVSDDILTERTAREIKSMGKALLCYTVNNPDRAQQLYGWGVDAVFSDAPNQV
jgi:glycerophosphoryl diester phosphodiesterase